VGRVGITILGMGGDDNKKTYEKLQIISSWGICGRSSPGICFPPQCLQQGPSSSTLTPGCSYSLEVTRVL